MPEQLTADGLELRYPIGTFTKPVSSTASTAGVRMEHIRTLRVLPERLAAAVADLSDLQLDTPYREGGWTVRQVVHHLADSHANAYVRVKLALTEDWPTVKGYDEAAWAELPDGRLLPVSVSLEMLGALHARWVTVWESLTEEDFRRGYVHSQYGRVDLSEALASYDWHSRHHTAHIVNLRRRMGW